MRRIILIGMKGCGKTTVGALLAAELGIPFIDCDAEIEAAHKQAGGEALPFRQIFARYGKEYFHALERDALKHLAKTFADTGFVLACGGSTPLQQENRTILSGLGKIIFLNVEKSVLLKRILAQGMPAFFQYPEDPARSLHELLESRLPAYQQCADLTLDVAEEAPEMVVSTILMVMRSHGKD